MLTPITRRRYNVACYRISAESVVYKYTSMNEVYSETDVSAIGRETQADPRVPRENENAWRSGYHQETTPKRTPATRRVTVICR